MNEHSDYYFECIYTTGNVCGTKKSIKNVKKSFKKGEKNESFRLNKEGR